MSRNRAKKPFENISSERLQGSSLTFVTCQVSNFLSLLDDFCKIWKTSKQLMTAIQKEARLRQAQLELELDAAPLLILKPRLILQQGAFIQFIFIALNISALFLTFF